jgi:hypothetical protein
LASSKRRRRGGSGGKVIAAAAIVIAILGLAILAIPFLVVDVDAVPEVNKARPKPTPVSTDYAGSLTCVECHQEICEKYVSHPMNHAMDGMPQDRPLEKFDQVVFPEGKLLQYRVEQRDKRLVHHETLTSAEGKVIYDLAEPIAFALGSGQRGRSYLIKKDGLLFQSPIGWYSGAQKWDLSPGYGYPQNDRFERRIGVGCLYCHAGILNPNPEQTDAFLEPTFKEMPISCERCHGPAKSHVDIQRRGGPSADEVDSIVNPKKLEPMQREHVCYQCHLQGEAVVPRYGRTHADFRPGMLLDDVWTVFVSKQGAEARGAKAVSHVEQMHASECFKASKGKMGCTSCHDPHSKPKPEERIAYYNQRCASCHTNPASTCKLPETERNAAPAGGSCIACHMPASAAADVAHTALTDHRILAKPLEFPLTPSKEMTPLRDLIVFDGGESRLPAEEINRGKAILLTNRAGATTIGAIDQVVTELLIPAEHLVEGEPTTLAAISEDIPALHALAFAYFLEEKRDQAAEIWERILEIDPNDESAISLLFAQKLDLDPVRSMQLSDRLLKLNPNMALGWGRRAYLLGLLNRTEEAISAGEKALELDPRLTQVHEWLAERYAEQGSLEKSLEHRQILSEFAKAAAALGQSKPKAIDGTPGP